MPRVPAICGECKTVFPSGLNVRASNVAFQNCTAGSCPKCGATGIILNGVYSAIGDALQALVGQQDIETLKKFLGILEHAKENDLEADEVSKRIRDRVPSFSIIADCLPRTRAELYAFIVAMAMLIGLMRDSGKKHFSQQEINQYQEITIKKVFEPNNGSGLRISGAQRNSVEAPVSQEQTEKKTMRNDPCPCGSGKKFKKCCGNR